MKRWITFGALGPITSYLLFTLGVLASTVASKPQAAAESAAKWWSFVSHLDASKLVFYLPAAALGLIALPLYAKSGPGGSRRWGLWAAAATLLGLPQLLLGLLVFGQPALAIAVGLFCGAAALGICSAVARAA